MLLNFYTTSISEGISLTLFRAYLKTRNLKEKSIKNLMMVLNAFLDFNREVIPKIPTFPKITPQSVDRYAKYQLNRVGEIMRGKVCANLVQEKNEVPNYAKK